MTEQGSNERLVDKMEAFTLSTGGETQGVLGNSIPTTEEFFDSLEGEMTAERITLGIESISSMVQVEPNPKIVHTIEDIVEDAVGETESQVTSNIDAIYSAPIEDLENFVEGSATHIPDGQDIVDAADSDPLVEIIDVAEDTVQGEVAESAVMVDDKPIEAADPLETTADAVQDETEPVVLEAVDATQDAVEAEPQDSNKAELLGTEPTLEIETSETLVSELLKVAGDKVDALVSLDDDLEAISDSTAVATSHENKETAVHLEDAGVLKESIVATMECLKTDDGAAKENVPMDEMARLSM